MENKEFKVKSVQSEQLNAARNTATSITTYGGESEYKDFENNRRAITRNLDETNVERIDVHSGILCFEHMDFSTKAKLPASISHMYLSVAKNADNSKYGNGWRLSTQQSVRTESTKYIYTDALGKEHTFLKSDADEQNRIEDFEGIHLTLVRLSSGVIKITDRAGNVMEFDSTGKITSVKDKNQNTLTYSYANGLLSSLTDSQGKSLTLTYDSATGLLKKITDPKNRVVTFNYDTNNNLTEIVDPDGIKTTFTYFSNNRLDMVGARKIQRCYWYQTDSDKMIAAGEYHSANQGYEYYEQYLTYTPGKTVFVNEYNVRHTYLLDSMGRCATEYEDIRREYNDTKGQLTGCMNYTYRDNKCVRAVALRATDEGSKNYLQNGSFESMTGWTVTGSGETVDDAFIDGTKSYKFNNGYGTKSLTQRVYFTGDNAITFGDTLFLSCWARYSVVKYNEDELTMKIVLKYTDGTQEENLKWFNAYSTDWQYNVATIKPNPQKTISYADITLSADDVLQNSYFDNVRLVSTFSTTSDDEDDLSESTTVFGVSETIKQRITQNNGIVTTITENGTHYRPIKVKVNYKGKPSFTSYYKYDAKGNLIASQDYRGNVVLYTYDAKGNVIKTRAYHSNSINTTQSLVCPTKHFVNEYTYDGEYLTEEYDQRSDEIKSTFDYDTNSGLVNFDVDNGGQRTDYTYHEDTFAPLSVSTIVNGQNNCVNYSYTNRELTKITHNGFDYDFEYDGFGRRTKVTAGGETLSESVYTKQGNTLICETTYGTGEKTKTTTDEKKRAVKTEYKKEGESEYTTLSQTEYDDLGKVTKFIDNETNTQYTYTYDELGNLLTEKKNNNTVKRYEYDEWLRPKKVTITENGTIADTGVNATYITDYETNADNTPYPDNAVKKLTLQGVFSQTFDKDENQRLIRETLEDTPQTFNLKREFTYLEQGNRLTGLVEKVKSSVNNVQQHEYKYYYDNNANITKVVELVGTNEAPVVEYAYDGLNRLVRENNYELNQTFCYGYNEGGNITHKAYYEITPNGQELSEPTGYDRYEYYDGEYGHGTSTSWGDKLALIGGNVSYKRFTYDEVGNPITYAGNTLEWDKVRRLTKFGDLTFEYNASGERTKKGRSTYFHVDGKLVREDIENYDEDGNETYSDEIRYNYGATGVEEIIYDGVAYFLHKNLQGDVVEIYNDTPELVGKYVYDAWGNCTIVLDTSGIAAINPIRYRGYYYDTETGLYYLKSRYYDPTTCRFINADGLVSTGQGLEGYNMFAYCNNNPVNAIDKTGTRTYFLNGINNPNETQAPEYSYDFQKKLTELGVEDVRVISVYNGTDFFTGCGEVAMEMLNNGEYSDSIAAKILEDLKNDPLAEGEELNLIGYSGGGQIVLNVCELLSGKATVNNTILIATPVYEPILNNTGNITFLISGFDFFSWFFSRSLFWNNTKFENVSWIGHTSYFKEANINRIAGIVDKYIN